MHVRCAERLPPIEVHASGDTLRPKLTMTGSSTRAQRAHPGRSTIPEVNAMAEPSNAVRLGHMRAAIIRTAHSTGMAINILRRMKVLIAQLLLVAADCGPAFASTSLLLGTA
jgi:hypothetical protein